jgi:DNA-directed RNA polymerase subunit RPC12/RpoP
MIDNKLDCPKCKDNVKPDNSEGYPVLKCPACGFSAWMWEWVKRWMALTTEEAVRYIEHGPEMEELLGRAVKTTNAKYLREDIETLLAKLEGK